MPKTSSYEQRSSSYVEGMSIDAEQGNLEHSAQENEQALPATQLKNKAIVKVKGILKQLLLSKKQPADSNLEQLLPEDKARKNLSKLIKLALAHPDYLKTEGVLRLFTNEVEKQVSIDNMDKFFAKTDKSMPKVNLLTVLIKHFIKFALSLEQKRNICLAIGISQEELDSQNLSELRYQQITQNLDKEVPELYTMPPSLIDLVYFCKEIVKNQSQNKMPASAIAISLAPTLLPKLKNSPEYLLTLLRFEMQTTSLVRLALKKWIDI